MNVLPRNLKPVLLGSFILLFPLLSHDAAQGQSLTSIDVTPANPTINVGQTQPFTATGHYSDGSTHALSPGSPIDGGTYHTCAVLSDGAVKCWGINNYGQLGNGTNTSSNTPVSVSGISTATAIAAGGYHTCALISDGTVNCWGVNSYGQLGNGTNTGPQNCGGNSCSTVPVPVTGITNATAIAAGYTHTCAVLSDGTVKCWGYNNHGQLGNGTNTDSSTPVTVSGISTVTAISTTFYHTCALISDGTVNCWGDDAFGQLGNGTTTDSSIPVAVSGISTATRIAAGYTHTCAVLSDGAAKCWGQNLYGELGNGTNTESNVPVSVGGITAATAIAAGQDFTCAVLSDGAVKCWGWNDAGQLGNGTNTDSNTPVPVSGISTAAEIAAGEDYPCAVLSDGTVQCWGFNVEGQLGNGTNGDSTNMPATVIGISPANAIGTGGFHSCAVLSNGNVECWGEDNRGQLGNGTIIVSTPPVQVSGISTGKAVAAGRDFTCALLSDGTVNCWGDNTDGQLGIGTNTGPEDCGGDSCSTVPVHVSGITTATAIAVGGFHACALLGGPVYCWGFNDFGQLGDGTNSGPETCNYSNFTDFCSTTPVAVSGISTAAAIAAGYFHTCAVLSDGTVSCWGFNGYGQLGNGTMTNSSTPVTVSGISTATAIATTFYHTCALLSDGTVSCWGLNRFGQLGDGTNTGPQDCGGYSCSTVPVPVTGITNATAIAAGSDHTCALLSDGTVKCWGNNAYGQLGDGMSTGPETCMVSNTSSPCSTTPVGVSGITSGTAISSDNAHVCALLSDGNVTCWGYNFYDQLGNGSIGPGFSTTPLTAIGPVYAVTWTSSNSAVATINANGVATGLSPGATTITDASGSIRGSTTLMVGGSIQPDLIISALSTATTAIAPGRTLSLSNTVKNQGTATAASSVEAFHLSTNTTYGDGDDIAFTTTRSVVSLAAGASSTASTTLTIPATTPLGTYYICSKADNTAKVAESNENNNSSCTGATIQVTRADLVMTNVTPNASTVNQGGILPVANTVANQGLISSTVFRIAFHLSVDSTYGGADDVAISTIRSVTSLGPGISSAATTNLTIPAATPPNAYYVCAKADSLGQVAEADETNNTFCSSTLVTVPAADLTMTVVSTTATVVAPGKTFTLSNTVKNQGGSKAGAFMIAFHLSSDSVYGGADDTVLTATRSVTSLAIGANSAATTTLTVPATAPLGIYHVCAMPDSGSTVAESNELNNPGCTTTTIQVTRPDLVMTAVTPNAATVNRGATLSVGNTVQNQGLIASTAFRVGFRLSVNNVYGDSDDVVIATNRSVTSLAAGANSTATTSITIPGTTPVGTYYVCAMADSLNAVVETNEGNNTLCSGATVTVQ